MQKPSVTSLAALGFPACAPSQAPTFLSVRQDASVADLFLRKPALFSAPLWLLSIFFPEFAQTFCLMVNGDSCPPGVLLSDLHSRMLLRVDPPGSAVPPFLKLPQVPLFRFQDGDFCNFGTPPAADSMRSL